MKRWFLLVLVLILSGCTAAPTATIEPSKNPPTAVSASITHLPESAHTPEITPIKDLRPYIEEREIALDELWIAENVLGTTGELLSMSLRNESKTPRQIALDCGVTFRPKYDPDFQSLILIQPLEISIASLDWTQAKPMVACIDPEKTIPPKAEDYLIGPMAEGELKKLADCTCQTALDPADVTSLLTVQIAFWFTTSGIDSAGVNSMSDLEILDLLSAKNIDAATLETVKAYMPFLRSAVTTKLEGCGL